MPIPRPLAEALVNLTARERVELVCDIWDSIDTGYPGEEAVAAFSRARIAEYRRDPSAMVTWDDLSERLRSKSNDLP